MNKIAVDRLLMMMMSNARANRRGTDGQLVIDFIYMILCLWYFFNFFCYHVIILLI